MKAKIEATVCDLKCRRVATESFTWKQKDGTTITNDLCDEHYEMLVANGHAPRRGYRPNGMLTPRQPRRTAATGPRKGTPRKKVATRKPRKQKTAARKPRKKRSDAGKPRKKAADKPETQQSEAA